jgi:hypothetical protein
VHVTLRAGLGPLRSQHIFPTLQLAIARAGRRDPECFRIVHFSVQSDHVHLLVEATDNASLSAGMRGLMVRVARYVNDLLMRRGRFWADRWHARALATPREVRHALLYVLANVRKHAKRPLPAGVDPCSSGAGFGGWRAVVPASGVPPGYAPRPIPFGAADGGCPVSAARTWLLAIGWRRHGLLRLDESPKQSGHPSSR